MMSFNIQNRESEIENEVVKEHDIQVAMEEA